MFMIVPMTTVYPVHQLTFEEIGPTVCEGRDKVSGIGSGN